jgi:hypothetical protein
MDRAARKQRGDCADAQRPPGFRVAVVRSEATLPRSAALIA